jgi:choice-of-anchor C domain-containing protein
MKNIIALAVSALLVGASAQAASVVNGSFEENASIGIGSFATQSVGSTAITGWTIEGGNLDWIGSYWQNAEGSRSLDLNGGGPVTISQSLTGLVIGQQYAVSFAMSGNPAGSPPVKSMNVSVGNEAADYTYDVTGNTRSAMNWIYDSFTFNADGTSEVLRFASTISGAYGPALDNVSISEVTAPIPLPAAAWLLGGALAGLGALRRRS